MNAPPSPLIDRLASQLRPTEGHRPRPDDRRVLATLRRQARTLTAVDPQAAAVVYPAVGRDRVAQDAGMLVACLWATWHTGYDRPVNADGTNVGGALRHLPTDRAQHLFDELAAATGPTLPTAMHHAVTALAAAGVALDWRQTHHDLRRWMYGDSQRVLRRWATALYGPERIADEE